MKVGSLVELVKPFSLDKKEHWETYPILKKIYTVRTIESHKGMAFIRLFEIVNPLMQYRQGFTEAQFNIIKFRELQPPIANIEEHINENTLTPELI